MASRLQLRGPLGRFLEGPARLAPEDYASAPSEALVLRDGDRVLLEPLAGDGEALFTACDGSRTVAQLTEAFGPEADARLRRWFRHGLVEDASP